MLSFLSEELTRYVDQHAGEEDPLLAELRDETVRTLPLPQMQVGPVEGALLRTLVAIMGARTVLELGTYSGYSALCMAAALPSDGQLITCDIDPTATAVAKRYFARSPHGTKISLRLGDARRTLDELAEQHASLDFVFIDANKTSYPTYWEKVVPLVRKGGLIVGDNALWGGRVLAPKDADDAGIVRFNQLVRDDPRVDQVLLSVRDGMMLARKL